MEETENKFGAGFIVFKKETLDSDKPLMLALVQHDGVYDIPKGRTDKGESSLETAKRECFEECSIIMRDEDIIYSEDSPFINGLLTTFCGVTSQEPMVTKNPHSGILEHAGFKWVDEESFCSNCLSYLSSPVRHFYYTHAKVYNGNK